MSKRALIVVTAMALLMVAGVFACRSRYSTVVYNVIGEERVPLETRSSYYLKGFILRKKPGIDPLLPGDGTVMVSRELGQDPDQAFVETGLISAVSEIEYRFYTKLPDKLNADSIDIKGESICRIIGYFELDDEIRHYECREGYLKIDSVKSNQFYARWRGKYFNSKNDSLIFEGDLHVRER